MHTLRGYENTLTDLYLEREKIELLADRIVEYDLAIIRNISSRFPGMIHGFSFSDDWGTEQMLMINPRLWQEFFKPRYQRLFDACHQAGWHVWMHSCGKVNDIIGYLIDIGWTSSICSSPPCWGLRRWANGTPGKYASYRYVTFRKRYLTRTRRKLKRKPDCSSTAGVPMREDLSWAIMAMGKPSMFPCGRNR